MNYQAGQPRNNDALLGHHARQLFSLGGWEYDPESQLVHLDEESQAILSVDTQSLSRDSLFERVDPEDRVDLASALQTAAAFDYRLTIDQSEGNQQPLRIRGEPKSTESGMDSAPASDGSQPAVSDGTDQESEEYEYPFHGVIQAPETEQESRNASNTNPEPVTTNQEEHSENLPIDMTSEQLQGILQRAELACWEWDIEANRLWGNDYWIATVDVEHTDGIVNPDDWLASVHPDDLSTAESIIESRFKPGGQDTWRAEYRVSTRDDKWVWQEDTGEVIERDSEGRAIRAAGITRQVDDRKAAEQLLREERDMFADGSAVVFRWRNEPGWPVEYVSSNVTKLLGYTPKELQTGTIEYNELIHPADRERVGKEVAQASDSETARFKHEPYRLLTSDGSVCWVLDYTKLVRDEGGITHYIGYLVDITEQKQREQKREQLNEAAQELLTSQSKAQIFETVRTSARDLFETEWAVTYRYDSDQEALVPSPPSEDAHTIGPGEHPLWDVFVASERTTVDASSLPTPCPETEPPSETVAVFPLGGHGLCLCCETVTDEQTTEFGNLLSAMAGVTLDRVEEMAQRTRQSERLQHRAERLEQLTQLHRTICSLFSAITETNSREETYRTICETLVTIDGFAGAWVGKPNGNELAPIAQAGLPAEFLEKHPRDLDAPTPSARCVRTKELISASKIPERLQHESWRAGALSHNLRSALSIPLEHGDIFHGALTVYATETDEFDGEIAALLTDLATVTSYLFNLRERYETIRGETVVELTFEVELHEGSPLATLATQMTGDVVIENLLQRQPNAWLIHCRVDDANALVDAGEPIPGIERIDRLNQQTVELLVIDDRVLTGVGTLGAELDSLTLDGNTGTLTINVDGDHRVRNVTATVEDIFERVSLKAKRHSETTAVKTKQATLTDSLTERQQTILRTAYYSGYFDRDRSRTGAEIAEILDISQPTFSNHIRAAQQNFFEAVFGPRSR